MINISTKEKPELLPYASAIAMMTNEQSYLSQQQVEEALFHGHPIRGAVLDSIQFRQRKFDRAVDLSEVIFSGETVFEAVTFEDTVSFYCAQFRSPVHFRFCRFNKAVFQGAKFRSIADFTGCHFSQAYFWRAHFHGNLQFSDVVIAPSAEEQVSRTGLGETNFSFALFRSDADFSRARLGGPCYFYGTVFRSNVMFTETKFTKEVFFWDRSNSNICLDRSDFEDVINGMWPETASIANNITPDKQLGILNREYGLFSQLLKSKIIKISREHLGAHRLPEAYVQFADYLYETSLSEVNERLVDLNKKWKYPWFPNGAQIFKTVYLELAHPMFSKQAKISFQGAEFSEQAKPHFENTNLQMCSFKGASLDSTRFANVSWDLQPMLFGKRNACYDERDAKRREEFEFLRRMYTTLMLQYESSGDAFSAQEFYFGSMEMQRKAGKKWLALHKYMNGYNTSLPLASFWLAVFLLLVFPLIYLVLGTVSTFSDAVFHSLWLSQFLADEVVYTPTVASRVAQIAQLICVILLMGSVGIVVKKKLKM